MPTTLPRTQITHTREIQHALDVARRRWPGQRSGALLVHLIEEGARTVESSQGELMAERRAQIEQIAAKYSGLFKPGDLDEIRQGWPQ